MCRFRKKEVLDNCAPNTLWEFSRMRRPWIIINQDDRSSMAADGIRGVGVPWCRFLNTKGYTGVWIIFTSHYFWCIKRNVLHLPSQIGDPVVPGRITLLCRERINLSYTGPTNRGRAVEHSMRPDSI